MRRKVVFKQEVARKKKEVVEIVKGKHRRGRLNIKWSKKLSRGLSKEQRVQKVQEEQKRSKKQDKLRKQKKSKKWRGRGIWDITTGKAFFYQRTKEQIKKRREVKWKELDESLLEDEEK